MLDDKSAALTHHLPAGFEADCFFDSASALGRWMVVEQSSSRTAQNALESAGSGCFLVYRSLRVGHELADLFN